MSENNTIKMNKLSQIVYLIDVHFWYLKMEGSLIQLRSLGIFLYYFESLKLFIKHLETMCLEMKSKPLLSFMVSSV